MWEDLNFQESIKELKKAGPRGHTLAHITPEEGRLLEALGGSGRINPNTDLPQYDTDTYGNESSTGNVPGSYGTRNPSAGLSYGHGDPRYGRGRTTPTRPTRSTDPRYGRGARPSPTTAPSHTQDDGPSPAEIAAAAEAERQRLAALEAARVARVAAGRQSVTDRLNTLAGTYDTSGYGEAFSSEFADDLLEDYADAQRGLDTAFLTSGDYSAFHGEAGTLADQQAALDALLTGGEQTSLDTQAAAYQAQAQGEYDAWLAANQAAIAGVTTEIDYDDFDFTGLDLSGYDTPTGTFDPEFFQDYDKEYDDPTGTYFGEPGRTDDDDGDDDGTVTETPASTSAPSSKGTRSTRPQYYTPTSRSTSSRSSSRVV